jgi:hypothetical protein
MTYAIRVDVLAEEVFDGSACPPLLSGYEVGLCVCQAAGERFAAEQEDYERMSNLDRISRNAAPAPCRECPNRGRWPNDGCDRYKSMHQAWRLPGGCWCWLPRKREES